MRGRVLLILMLATTAARPQVAPSATGGGPTSQTQMMTPPSVSGVGYPTEVGAEVRTNYLRGGLTSTTSYVNNLYAGSGSTSIAETTVSVLPTIDFDSTSGRRHAVVSYSPGFTFYQPSSALNEVDNTAKVECDFHLTVHTALSATDSFQDSSSPFSPGYAGAGGNVSGAPVSFTPGVIPPFAKRLSNSANVELSVQTGPNVMIGGSGLETELNYPNPAQTPGLYDSNSRGGSAFYNRRISRSQYFGATYQYLDMLANPGKGTDTTVTQTISGSYTFQPMARLSLSVSGGPQYYQTTQPSLPATGSWGPSVTASMGWQGTHTSFAANYSQGVTGGGGLLGAYNSKNASATARWQMARTWNASASGAYSINKTIGGILNTAGQNGHSTSESATLDHSIGEQLDIAFHYDHIDQSYGGIAVIAANPNSDRETISITWHFQRPIGR
jgi:hypothetical protein